MMIAADIARALLTAVIPLATALHASTLTVIYTVVVPIEAFSALFDAASDAAGEGAVPGGVGVGGRLMSAHDKAAGAGAHARHRAPPGRA